MFEKLLIDARLGVHGYFEIMINDLFKYCYIRMLLPFCWSSHTTDLLDLIVECLLHEDEDAMVLDLPVFQRQTCLESTVTEEHTCTEGVFWDS